MGDENGKDDTKVLEDARKLGMAQRVEHKLWKVRAEAYDDMKTTCQKIMSSDDPALSEYSKLLSKCLTDANAPALDKALEALLACQAKCSVNHAASICDKCCSSIFTKAMNGRPGTVVKATEVLLYFVELEQSEKVVEHVIAKGLAHKVPKVVAASVDFLLQSISAFGTKVIAPQAILKALPPHFESRDVKIREKVKVTVVELSRWVGAEVVKNLLFDKMREAMQGDISKLIDQAPEGRPKATRLTRSEQLRLEAQEAAGSGEPMDIVEEEEEEQVVDEFDLSAPAEVLGELSKDFWAGLQEKKWLLRKESLTTLKDLASKPRLASGDYGDVIRELKKVITKDSNVQCIAEACNCVGALAKGLRQDFTSAAKSFVPILLEKFKEKNPVVSRSVPEALVLVHKHCLALQDVIEEALAALGHANPKVRQQTLEWLQVCTSSESKDGLKPIQAQIVAGVTKLADDPTPAIREAALSVLLELCLKAAGVAQIEKITSKLADNRRKKLEEMLQNAKQNSKPVSAPAPAAAPSLATSPSIKAPKKVPAKPPPVKKDEDSEEMQVDSAPVRKGPPPLSTRQPAKSAAVKQVKLAGPPPGEDDDSLASGVLGKEQCEEQLSALFGEEAVTDLRDPVWKKRMEALDSMLAAYKEMDMVAHARLIVNGMATLPGWDEKNFQVMSRQFEFLRLAAENGGKSFGKSEAFLSIKGLVEKMGDIKLKTPAFDALSMICEAVGPQFVFDQLHSKASGHKNPKVLAETLNWMSRAIDEFGLGIMNTKNLINYVLVNAASTNPAVKNAAVGLAGCMHKFVGPALGEMLQSGVKPAQMTTIQQAFEKNPQVSDFVPTRVPRSGGKKMSGGSKDSGKGPGASSQPAFDPDELLPRTDISSQITSSLVAKLSDPNWKNRKAGLEDIETILSEAGNRIQANTGELMSALKGITKDSNGNLVATGIRLMGKIATAMGKAIDRQGRPMLSPCLMCISDTKTLVRAAVIEMLSAWVAAAGVPSVMPELAATAAGPKCSADGKIEFVNWVSGLVKGDKEVKSSLEHICKLVAVACTDKLSTVKSAGNGLMQLLVEKYGTEVAVAAKALDGPTKKIVMEAMQKCGGGVPASEPAKAVQTSSAGSSPRTSAAPKRPGSATGSRPAKIPAGRASTPPLKPKVDEMDIDKEALFQLSDGKDTRARKNRGKRAKYDGIPPNELEMLKSELGPLVSTALKGLLFDADFKKHCTAAEMITSAVGSLYPEIISCLDLIFRWSVIRIVEANTQCLVKTLDMLKVIIEAMIEGSCRMSEYEAIILLPVLVEKSGHNQDRIKKDHRELMALTSKVLSPSKLFVYLADGLESKNNKTKVECAEEIGSLIDREGMKIATGQKQVKAFPVIATAVSSRDASFRKACLTTLATVYDFEGPKIWKLLGRLTDQQRSLIEERLKVHSRELHKQGLVPGFRNEDAPAVMEEEVVVKHRASPPQRGAFGFSPSTANQLPPESRPLQAAPTGRLMNPRAGGIPMLKNLGGIPRPESNSPSQGCAMESSRTASPGTASPLPDPPEAIGNHGIPVPDEQRSDTEVEEVWTRAMITMVGGPLTESIDALKVLCYELMEASRGRCSNATMQLMADSADELVKELVNKLDVVFYDAATHCDPPSNRGCKYTLNTMMQVAGIPSMAKMLQKSTLKDTISFLLSLLLDERLPGVHEGNQLMKAMNVLVLRMLDICNKNSLFGLLLEILRTPPQVIQEGTPDIQDKFSNLVIKCLIKMTKSMGNVLTSGSEGTELDTTQLLWDIHTYFSGLGMDEIHRRSKEDDKPLKMVKTILHEVCRHKGGEVVRYVGDIPRDEESPIILAYIDLNLQTLHDTGIISGNLPPAFSHNDHVMSQYFGSIEAALSPRQQHDPPLSPDRSAASSMSGDGIGPDTMKAELAAIFKKIGDKTMSREGMVDLYHFQQEHAAVDVMPYLSNTSDAFQAYIERGLQRIHAKRSATQNRTPTSTPVSVSAPSSGVNDGDEMEVDEVSECSPRCATPTVNVPTPRSIPRPGGIPKPKNEKPAEVAGDQIRSLKDFRNINRFGRRD